MLRMGLTHTLSISLSHTCALCLSSVCAGTESECGYVCLERERETAYHSVVRCVWGTVHVEDRAHTVAVCETHTYVDTPLLSSDLHTQTLPCPHRLSLCVCVGERMSVSRFRSLNVRHT